MADPRKIARQWLETDAAFGVAEVPVGKRKREAGSHPSRASGSNEKPEVRTATVAIAPRQSVPAILNADTMGRIKKAPASDPLIAGENIPELPAITKDEKIERLRMLEEQTLSELAAYINNISTRLVFGEGDPDAGMMFVGEGPGAEEDRTGRPFVGRSGQLLDKMINAIGLQRAQVYIGNVVKLRAADPDSESGRLKDRPPSPDEVARGLPYLHKQIEIIRPKVIVTLGGPAIKHLTGETQGVMSIRGQWRNFRGIPVMPTYHPAFVLRSYTEENRRKVWMDLQAAMKRIGNL